MRTLYLVLGSIGSGKSTIADLLLSTSELKGAEYIGADLYKRLHFHGALKIREAAYRCADELAFRRLQEALRTGKDVVFELCPTNLNKLEFLKRMVHTHGYRITGFFVGTESHAINVERCVGRGKSGGDAVSDEKIISRFSEAFARVPEVSDATQEMYFLDNSSEVPHVVAFVGNRRIWVLDDGCRWFKSEVLARLVSEEGTQ